MPKVSIIVPVYNVEKYIHRCIDSIISQSFTDWELILVDDGSPDRSGAICDEYAQKDSRIQVIHKENGGVGAARNTGLEYATGEFVAFVDSDDFCENTYLENFGLNKTITVDLVIQGYKKFVGEESPGRNYSKRLYTRNNFVEGILDNGLLSFGAPYCKLFRRDFIERNNIRFSTKYSFGEDTYFFFHYLTHIYNMQMVEGTGYFYRCEQVGSLSVKNHEFLDLTSFANDSLDLIRRIDSNYRLEVAYSHSYVGLYARALANMYRLGYNWRKRMNCIRSVKNDKSNIRLFDENNSYKITYLVARTFPSFMVDIFLCIYNKLNH